MSHTFEGKPRGIYSGPGGFMARAIDAVLSPIAPGLVLSRMRARERVLLRYDMAERKRSRKPQRSGSADGDLLRDLPAMRVASRSVVRDDSTASALVRVLEDNVIGSGLRPQMMVDRKAAGLSDTAADDWNREVETFFASVVGEIDASERDSFYELQRIVFRTVVVDGEALLHRTHIEPQGTPRAIGTAYELVDVDRLANDFVMSGRDIRAGVEVGDRGQPVAYWIHPRHPEDVPIGSGSADLRANVPKRMPRDVGLLRSILHVFRRDRAGQTRGVPFLASCFGLVDALSDMLATELDSARAASKFCAFIKQTGDPTLAGGFEQDSDGQTYEALEAATIRYLNDGEDVVPYSPNRPGNNFEPFVISVMRSISAALGVPYEMTLRSFGGMNYSSARVALLEARRGFEQLQQMMIDQVCQPIFEAVCRDGVASGKLRAPKGFLSAPRMFLQPHWQPPAWGWVDPVKEIEAAKLAIDSSLSSPQAEASRQGGDAEANLEAHAKFLQRAAQIEKAYGLKPGRLTEKPAAPQTAAPQQPAVEKKDAEAE